MKKQISLFLAMVLILFCFNGCGRKETPTGANDKNSAKPQKVLNQYLSLDLNSKAYKFLQTYESSDLNVDRCFIDEKEINDELYVFVDDSFENYYAVNPVTDDIYKDIIGIDTFPVYIRVFPVLTVDFLLDGLGEKYQSAKELYDEQIKKYNENKPVTFTVVGDVEDYSSTEAKIYGKAIPSSGSPVGTQYNDKFLRVKNYKSSDMQMGMFFNGQDYVYNETTKMYEPYKESNELELFNKPVEGLIQAIKMIEGILSPSNSGKKENWQQDILQEYEKEITKSTSNSTFIPNSTQNVQGNTTGNIVNGGHVAIQGDRIYYSNGIDDGKLYTMKTDGSSKQKLCDDDAFNINVVGGWIYYCNRIDNWRIYRIKTDGSNRQKLNNAVSSELYVIGDKIYCEQGYSEIYGEEAGRYTMKTDGSGKQRLGYNSPEDYDSLKDYDNLKNIYISDGKIYCTAHENDSLNLYVMKSSGSGKQKLSDDIRGDIVAIVRDRIYYSTNSAIYTIKIDGSGKQKLSDDSASSINVAGDKIYYSNRRDNNKLYVMKIDGSGKQKLSDDSASSINIAGDRIYYLKSFYYRSRLYTMNIDGSGRQIANWWDSIFHIV